MERCYWRLAANVITVNRHWCFHSDSSSIWSQRTNIAGVFHDKCVQHFRHQEPILQSFCVYLLLSLYTIPLITRRFNLDGDVLNRHESESFLFGQVPFLQVDWWKYVVLAFIDVQANFVIVSGESAFQFSTSFFKVVSAAYQYTTIESVQLLDCFTVPCVMLFSRLLFKVRQFPACMFFCSSALQLSFLLKGALAFFLLHSLFHSHWGSRSSIGSVTCSACAAVCWAWACWSRLTSSPRATSRSTAAHQIKVILRREWSALCALVCVLSFDK